MTFVEKLTERLVLKNHGRCVSLRRRCAHDRCRKGDRAEITEDEARYLMTTISRSCRLASAFSWYDDQGEIVQLVLCDMAFNLGLPKLKQFKHASCHESGDMEATASELLDLNYARQVQIEQTKRKMLTGG